jgi:hypothetical protein
VLLQIWGVLLLQRSALGEHTPTQASPEQAWLVHVVLPPQVPLFWQVRIWVLLTQSWVAGTQTPVQVSL